MLKHCKWGKKPEWSDEHTSCQQANILARFAATLFVGETETEHTCNVTHIPSTQKVFKPRSSVIRHTLIRWNRFLCWSIQLSTQAVQQLAFHSCYVHVNTIQRVFFLLPLCFFSIHARLSKLHDSLTELQLQQKEASPLTELLWFQESNSCFDSHYTNRQIFSYWKRVLHSSECPLREAGFRYWLVPLVWHLMGFLEIQVWSVSSRYHLDWSEIVLQASNSWKSERVHVITSPVELSPLFPQWLIFQADMPSKFPGFSISNVRIWCFPCHIW